MQRRIVDGIQSPNSLRTNNSSPVRHAPDQNTHQHPLRRYSYVFMVASLMLAVGISILLIANQRRLHTAFTYASTGVESLADGLSYIMSEPAKAKASFDVGVSSFATTAAELRELNSVSKSLLIFPYAREGVQLLRIAYHASLAGESLSAMLTDKPEPAAPGAGFEETTSHLTSWLSQWPSSHQAELESTLTNLNLMNELLASLDARKLPGRIRPLVTQWQEQLPTTLAQAQAMATIIMQSPALFAAESPTRYVILFQNNTELRPTGGFIGSYASAEFNQGKLSDFSVQTNVYKADKAFAAQQPVEPPFPLTKISNTWGMRDANWAIDFPESAQQVLTFYEGIYGQPAQGVLAIDTSVITDLLRLTGPIDFPEYQTSLSADNFIDTVQYKVEVEYFANKANKEENEPKKMIADFIPKLFSAISNLPTEKKTEVWKIVAFATARKSILAYSTNETVEEAFTQMDIAGQVKPTTSDYLYINNANIAGGKSSQNIAEQVEIVQRPLNGAIEVTLKITRTHHGNGVWPDQDNNNYMRIMVPKGSTLIRHDDTFEYQRTDETNDRTVFGGWFSTPVASKKYAEITYQLPPSITPKQYSLLLQRQPGANPTTYIFDSPLIKKTSLTLSTDTLLAND